MSSDRPKTVSATDADLSTPTGGTETKQMRSEEKKGGGVDEQTAAGINKNKLKVAKATLASSEASSLAWGPEVVTLAIAAKKERRNKRGEPFNCFVVTRPTAELKTHDTAELIKKGDELVEFLHILKDNIARGHFAGTTQFQVAVYDYSTGHWTPLDFSITNG